MFGWVVLAGIAAAVVVVLVGRKVVLEYRGLKVTVHGIDKAVNGRPEGEPKLYDLAKAAHLTAADALTLGHRTASKVEELGELVGNHLAHHQAETDRAAARRR